MIHPSFYWGVLVACFGSCIVSGSASVHQEQEGKKNAFLRGQAPVERRVMPEKCGCGSCTESVLNSVAEGHSCESRIDWLISNQGLSEVDACGLVAGDEYPAICGGCDPSKCTDATDGHTPSPDDNPCGCSCSDEVWNTFAGDHTCGARISWLQTAGVETLLSLGMTDGPLDEAGACRYVSEEFPEICTCVPETCNAPTSTPNPTFTPSSHPTDSPTTKPPTQSPTKVPTASPITQPSPSSMCGCDSCTDDVLDSDAGGFTCRDRINWVIANRALSESESCIVVADEFRSVCGPCHSDYCGSFPPTSKPVLGGATVSVMSYNTQYTGYSDGRLPSFATTIVEVDADVVGLQECQDPNALADATGYALLRDTGAQNYILYKSSRLQEIEGGFMNIPRDDYAQRAITWGKFRVIGGEGIGAEFWFFNTHLPHRHNQAADPNTHARIGRSLLAKREELGAGNAPTIVVGDCNPFASSGAPEGSFESNLAAGGIAKVYQARGNTGGYGGLDKIFASQEHWDASNAADRGTGSSDHPAIAADMSLVSE